MGSGDLIRQGVVSSVNYEEGRVRVVYADKNNAVTQELPLLTFEYDMPKVGEEIYVAHQSNGVEEGVVLCRYWRDGELPVEFGPHIWRKELRDNAGSFLKFDRNTHTLYVDVSASPDISVDVKAAGDVNVTSAKSANITCDADICLTAKGNIFMKASKVFIDGSIEQKGDITSSGTVKAKEGVFGQSGQTVTVTTHKHKGVTAGISATDKPVLPS